MNFKLIAAAAVFAALPLCAQAQQQSKAPKPTNAQAQRLVKMISADKAKTQTYCAMAKLSEQMEQAQQKKDQKTVDALADKADALAEKLGPEWAALMEGLDNMDENSKEAQAIGETLDSLDDLCK